MAKKHPKFGEFSDINLQSRSSTSPKLDKLNNNNNNNILRQNTNIKHIS